MKLVKILETFDRNLLLKKPFEAMNQINPENGIVPRLMAVGVTPRLRTRSAKHKKQKSITKLQMEMSSILGKQRMERPLQKRILQCAR